MKLSMDNPSARVIELVPRTSDTEPVLSVKPPDYSKRKCEHGNFKVDTSERQVFCGFCKREMEGAS